jgi:hypothetical protein
MTDPAASSLHIARAIQLAVAPVFLLSGVGVTLGVLATRLGRIIDRARFLEGRAKDPEAPAHIALFTACALFICLLLPSFSARCYNWSWCRCWPDCSSWRC